MNGYGDPGGTVEPVVLNDAQFKERGDSEDVHGKRCLFENEEVFIVSILCDFEAPIGWDVYHGPVASEVSGRTSLNSMSVSYWR